jgi:hypothetical protein
VSVARSDSTAPWSRTFCLIQLLCETSARRRTSSSRVISSAIRRHHRPGGLRRVLPSAGLPRAWASPGGARDSTFGQVESRNQGATFELFDCGYVKGGRHPDVKLECPVHRPEGGGDEASLLAPGGDCARGVRSGLRARHGLERALGHDDPPEAGSVSDDDGAAQAAASAAATGGQCSPAAGATTTTASTSAPACGERGSATSTTASRAFREAAATACAPHPHARARSGERLRDLAQTPSSEATTA